VTVKIVDINGQQLAMLLDEIQDPGEYILSFNAVCFVPGIYFCTLNAGKDRLTKMLIVQGR
jgi:hypothetical protein